MSGTAFLEEIVSWDDEKRAEKVEEALPRLIICLENHNSHDEAIGILQILCQSFVPVVQQHQLEQKVFSKTSRQVCDLLDHVIEDLHDAVAEGQDTDCDHLIVMLQHIVSIVQCMEECVKHMACVADLQTCQVRSLMSCSFHVLKGSYSHCQQSSSLYGDRLPLLSSSLSAIFRTAHSLQMTLLNLVDKLTAAHTESKQDLQDIAEVCGSLFALCRLVACLDLKLTISLWKALSKLAGHQAGVLCEHIDVSGMVCYLCEEISTGVTHLLQSAPPANDQDEPMLSQGDEKAFMKSLRILGFQMKVLNALVRDFHDYLSDCVPDIHKLLLQLNSVLPPSLSAPKLQGKHEKELRQQLCNATQPLTSHFLSNTTFTSCVLKKEDSEEKSEFARLLLQVTVMDGVAQASVEVMAQWLDTPTQLLDARPCPNLLTAIFTSLCKCHVEVCLPVFLLDLPCEGQPERTLSVYQFVVEHMCAFIASCPARLFHIIEEELLHAVLSLNPICSQAATDCWCFLARYGMAALCWQHVQQVLSVVLHINSLAPFCSSTSSLTSLVCRLVKFLTPQYQAELVCLAPPADHLSVWAEVNVSMMSSEVAGDVCRALIPACLQALHDFSHAPSPSLAHAATVRPSMLCLHTIVQSNTTACHLTPQQGAQLVDLVSSMWKRIPLDYLFSSSTTADYLSALVTLTSDMVDQLEVTLLLQVLVIAHKIVTGSSSGDITLAVLHLMQCLGPLKLPPSFEQGQILRKISDVFAAGLTHKTASVQYAALEAFTRFAEHTAYEAVVPECLAQHEGLQDKVAAFLQKVPSPEGHQLDPVQYLQEQRQHFTARFDTPVISDRRTEDRSSEPESKRQKLGVPVSVGQPADCYQQVLDDLETLTQRVEKLQVDGAVPDLAVTRGKLLLQRWSVCMDQ